ncbi:unnamed protein product [Trichobilharzia regenti]|nr:unnamed protein product [Trichobilharzia regenti]
MIVYDGGHDIYSLERLPGITTDPVKKEVSISDPLGRGNLLLEYQIMEVRKVSTDDVYEYVRNPKATSLNIPQVDQKRDVYIPMELLNILPYQSPNASKADVASEVIRCAAVRPAERFRELQNFVNNMFK